jgi:hypothetical protein
MMTRRTTGTTFIAIAAGLYIARFLTAAIFGSGVVSWNTELFASMLNYVDQGLGTWSLVALVIGVLYLLWAELDELRAPK